MLKTYMSVLQAHFHDRGCLEPETLRAAGSLALVLGPTFAAAMPSFWPVLQKSLLDVDEPDVCLAGLAAFNDIVRAIGAAVHPFSESFLVAAIRALRFREGLDMRLRINFIGGIADVTVALGAQLRGVKDVMQVLGEEVATIHDRQSETLQEVCSSSDTSSHHMDVINIILQAYVAVVSSLHNSSGLLALQDFIAGVLDFLCCFARTMQEFATSKSWSLGVVLVGKISLAFASDLASRAIRSAEVMQLVKDLHNFSVECWDESLRPMSVPLADVLRAATSAL
jgi:hypothetical protein